MPVPNIFQNRRPPVDLYHIDAIKVNANFNGLSDGSALNDAIIAFRHLAPEVLALIVGGGNNLIQNPSWEVWLAGIPDEWAAVNAVVSKEVALVKFELASLKAVVTGSVVSTVSQSVPTFMDYAGLWVSGSVWIRTDTAGRVRLKITDGITTEYSTFAPGSSSWIMLSTTMQVGSSPSELTISLEADSGASFTYYADGAMLINSMYPISYQPVSVLNWVEEDFTLLVDGINDTFQLAVIPHHAGGVFVIVDGRILRLVSGGLGDYTISGKNIVFAAGSIPQLDNGTPQTFVVKYQVV
jgi:hypothetical protein